MSTTQRFPKSERMSSKKLIADLFKRGKSKRIQPYRLIHLPAELPLDVPLQVLISVPKKNIPKAAHRNKVKRRIREAFRRQKPELQQILASRNKQVAIAIVYTDMRVRPYRTILDNLSLVIAHLTEEYGEKGHSN